MFDIKVFFFLFGTYLNKYRTKKSGASLHDIYQKEI